MILRLLLVSAVASLGLEMPTGRDIASWRQSGRAWIDAKLAELEATLPTDQAVSEPAPAEVVASDLPETIDAAVAPVEVAEAPALVAPIAVSDVAPAVKSDEDRAFASIVEGMILTFSADVAPAAPCPEAPNLAVEPAEVPEVVNPGVLFANELNLASEGIVPPAPTPALSRPATIAEESALESRGERLVHAVQLTGQALNAWATFLQGPTVVSLHP